jgi:hypothetical protein
VNSQAGLATASENRTRAKSTSYNPVTPRLRLSELSECSTLVPHSKTPCRTGLETNGIFPDTAFKYQPEKGSYLCPGGKELIPGGLIRHGTRSNIKSRGAAAGAVLCASNAPDPRPDAPLSAITTRSCWTKLVSRPAVVRPDGIANAGRS